MWVSKEQPILCNTNLRGKIDGSQISDQPNISAFPIATTNSISTQLPIAAEVPTRQGSSVTRKRQT